jgi:hypothetical protein
VNVAAFLAWPPGWDGVFFRLGRTAREIRGHDRQLARMVFAIRSQFDPAETLICHARLYLPLGIRHLQLYVPEFEQYQLKFDPAMLSPVGRPMTSIRGGRLDFVRRNETGGKRVLALIVPWGTSLEEYDGYLDLRRAKPIPESEGTVYRVGIEAMR